MRLQTEAVLSIQALPSDAAEILRSRALLLENSLNPVQSRRESVDHWLSQGPVTDLPDADLERRIAELLGLGFKNFDSFHIASAELALATAFVTVDIRVLRAGARHAQDLAIRVVDPIQFLEELSEWNP